MASVPKGSLVSKKEKKNEATVALCDAHRLMTALKLFAGEAFSECICCVRCSMYLHQVNPLLCETFPYKMISHINVFCASMKHSILHCDIQSAIALAKNLVFHARTKHIDVRHHFVWECLADKRIDLEKIHTTANTADALTKNLSSERFQCCRQSMASHEASLASFFFSFLLTKLPFGELAI